MELKKCEYCGKDFIPKHRLQRFCCPEHQKIWAKENMRSTRAAEIIGKPIKCECCGKEFIATTVKSKFCSKECLIKVSRQKARERNMERKSKMKCEECGKPLGAYSSSHYCSKECSYEATKRRLREGKPASVVKEERKRKQKKPVLSIGEICRLAMAEHLTYGQYVEKYGV